jgi:hypothetical protein
MRSIVLGLALIPAVAHADKLTVEAGVGVGQELGITAPSAALGIGAWISPRLALTARVAAVTLAPQHDVSPLGALLVQDFRRTFVFAGPSLQYWLADHFWLGGGLGFADMVVEGRDLHGVGADLRAGYTVGAFDISLEIMPSRFPTGGGFDPITAMSKPSTTTGVALLAGYQFR